MPEIAAQLRRERRDSAKAFLIYAILRMEELSYYSAVSNSQLMALMNDATESIEDENWREMASEFLEGIRSTQHFPHHNGRRAVPISMNS